MKDLSKYVRANILSLAPYSTARDEYSGELGVYLDANENPFENGYNRYPDPYQKSLKERIAQIKGIGTESIFIGNGSDEAIDLPYRIFCEPRIDNVVAITPTYGMYGVCAAINDVDLRTVALEEDFSLDTAKLLAATDAKTKLIFLCSPNNPTGNTLAEGQIEQIAESFDGIVIVDEAYIDFCEKPSMITRIASHNNIVVLQTLSKAWGMASLRLGMAFADPYIIELMTKVKYPYNINGLTQRVVLEQLERDVQSESAQIVASRKWVVEQMSKMPLVKHIYPSEANFVLIRVDEPKALYNTLIKSGIIVRDRSKVKGCAGCLRITIGTQAENEKLIEILRTQ